MFSVLLGLKIIAVNEFICRLLDHGRCIRSRHRLWRYLWFLGKNSHSCRWMWLHCLDLWRCGWNYSSTSLRGRRLSHRAALRNGNRCWDAAWNARWLCLCWRAITVVPWLNNAWVCAEVLVSLLEVVQYCVSGVVTNTVIQEVDL